MRKYQRAAIACAVILVGSAAFAANNAARPKPGFDFYVLSLSWSPSWCASHPDAKSSRQCDPKEDHGFIVHGLWPQNEHGYPDYCPTREPDRVPFSLGKQYLDLIPSMGLIGHEWRKHGVCSGLRQADYFAEVRQAYDAVNIPPALTSLRSAKAASPDLIENAFVAANPGLKPDGIAVSCEGGLLTEVRICLTKDLGFRACGEVDRNACRLSSVNIPPVR